MSLNGTPEDSTNIVSNGSTVGTAAEMSSDLVTFAGFGRLSAPPAATTSSASELAGQTLFVNIGCAACHTTALQTGKSIYGGMSNVTYHPYSDFALHHVESGLADGITQGNAGPVHSVRHHCGELDSDYSFCTTAEHPI